MKHPCSREGIDDLIIEHGAPTLLGAKPASLFTFVGSFSAAGPLLSTGGDATPRLELLNAIDEATRSIGDRDIHIEVLAWRPFGAVILMYRESLLTRALSTTPARAMLEEFGYARTTPRELPRLLGHLRQRFTQTCVPHEIGLFLGYPPEDVRGFMENGGRRCLFTGCWKVYANPRAAVRAFSRFRRCTRRARRLYRAGATVGEIARAARISSGGLTEAA